MKLGSPSARPTPELTATVVICTRNRPELLRKCLEAIARLARTPSEIIVVDSTSGDKETESVATEFSVRHLLEPVPGLSRARNRGLSESKSEIVAYIDDDSVSHERWLDFLIAPFADGAVAAVTGGTVLPGSDGAESSHEPNRLLCDKDLQWFEVAAFGGLGIGTNMALRRSPCVGWKVFDERPGRGAPFQGMEEHHAFVRLLSLRYSAVHIPAAIVFHRSQKQGDPRQQARDQIAYSMLLFFRVSRPRSRPAAFSLSAHTAQASNLATRFSRSGRNHYQRVARVVACELQCGPAFLWNVETQKQVAARSVAVNLAHSQPNSGEAKVLSRLRNGVRLSFRDQAARYLTHIWQSVQQERGVREVPLP